jgi:hypothetical protein
MMNMKQFFLTKLVEECAEVQQRALKQMQFGEKEIQEGQEKENRDRLLDEVEDLRAVLFMNEYIGNISEISQKEKDLRYNKKWDKILKYLNLSRDLGLVEKP